MSQFAGPGCSWTWPTAGSRRKVPGRHLTGDLQGLVQLLARDVVLIADDGGDDLRQLAAWQRGRPTITVQAAAR